jgi:hypothetical protein
VISSWLLRVFSSGQAKRRSAAPFSVFHSPSIAAIFCGWWCKVLRPCMSPATICSGAAIAASVSARRSTPGAERPATPLSSCHALSPASRNETVSTEASSMCVIRYGNDGLKITAIQSAAW